MSTPQNQPMPRPELKDRPELSIYWDNHLRVAFEEAAPHIYPAMVEASLAHVYMLTHQNILPQRRGKLLLQGLLALWKKTQDGEQEFHFDGSVEDPYYFLEQQLAHECGIPTSELDVQLARSRNDLDAGVFRMVLRRQLLAQTALVVQCAADAAAQALVHAESLIVGFTHRRPAQPTTIGHVLAGLSEAMLSQATEMLSIYAELNVSPLGSAAFTGTDLPIDSDLVGRLTGFDSSFTSSYEAVAGAEHFMRLAAVQARITATGARFSRVLLEWMTFKWVQTPTPYTQGSSIMPQKKNPVVLEHMVSMAGATAADMAASYANIGSAWYEDSNNATTDVQKHLWRAGDRVVRFMRMLDGLLLDLKIGQLPDPAEIVAGGATTTAVAEALAAQGIPWRAAHDIVGQLVRQQAPADWTDDDVTAAFEQAGQKSTTELVETTLSAGQQPELILQRHQTGSPGSAAVRENASASQARAMAIGQEVHSRLILLDEARTGLLHTARTAVKAGQW
ncbi:lyase family protein [Specibacter sp. NPDC078692]|uniref:lyase family protein n=1 Tax=Specibacter sp. NPDC078692 TaxID=3155818 RepID=UPI0034146F16